MHQRGHNLIRESTIAPFATGQSMETSVSSLADAFPVAPYVGESMVTATTNGLDQLVSPLPPSAGYISPKGGW